MKKLVAMLTMFVFVLAGCGAGSNSFDYLLSDPIESLDPTQGSSAQTFTLYSDIYLTPTKLNGDLGLENSNAQSIDVSADGLTYTIKLNPDVKWVDSSGEVVGDVTANDYVFAYRRMVDPASESYYSYIYEVIDNANEIMDGSLAADQLAVKAVDDYTLEIKLDHKAPYFESMLSFGAFAPEPQAAFEQYGSDYATSADTMWYNGPYYVTEFDPDYVVTVMKNDNYINADNVTVNQIDYRLNSDSTSRYNAFLNGEADYAELTTPEDYDEAISNGTAIDNLTAFSQFVVINQDKNAVTSNENLRKALSYGFDRNTIVESVFGDINQPIEYMIPKGVTPSAYDGVEYHDYSSDSLVTYDKDKADKYFDAYMKDMGYTDRKQIEVEFLASADSSGNSKLAEVVQSTYLQNFGITINTTIQPKSQFRESRNSGAFDMYVQSWGPDYADPSTYLSLWQTNQIGSQNHANYSNPKYDKEYRKANSEVDVESRFKDFAKLEKMLVDDGVVIPFYQLNSPYVLTEGDTMPMHSFLQVSHEYLRTNKEEE